MGSAKLSMPSVFRTAGKKSRKTNQKTAVERVSPSADFSPPSSSYCASLSSSFAKATPLRTKKRNTLATIQATKSSKAAPPKLGRKSLVNLFRKDEIGAEMP